MAKENKFIGTKIKAVPNEPQEIGIDLENKLPNEILDAVETSSLDLNSLESFSNVAQTREQIYGLIDTMAEDDRVSAVLETYAEDVVETNDKGQIVWCESSDEDVNNFVTTLLDNLNVDKHAYEWVYSLIKYGDLYLQLFRDDEDNGEVDIFNKEDRRLNESKDLKEDVNLVVSSNKPYIPYVKMKANPGEMFELTRRGKTMGYIEAPSNIINSVVNKETTSYIFYKMRESDVNIYESTEFVHGALYNNNSMRSPEEVTITIGDNEDESKNSSTTYEVRKGQSVLYNQFRTWRQMSLLENSILLSRITKSSVLRVLNIDIGDMPKEQAQSYLARLKSIIEQKSSISVGSSINEYTNPGSMENTIYVPVHNQQGTISAQTLGGDYDPKNLTDLDFFVDKFYGSLRVPKQYFNLTGDSTGFNGGTSLAIISSRYGKEIKQIQNIFIQTLTDLINLFLIDRGYYSYINKFKLRMQAPVTQEELDRRENMRNRMGVINDIMSQVGSVVEDNTVKAKILKSLLSTATSDPEIISLMQEYIEKLEKENEPSDESENEDKSSKERPTTTNIDINMPASREREPEPDLSQELGFEEEPTTTNEPETPTEVETQSSESSYLPSPGELGIDLTSNI